jgi:type II secretory pathway component HofQ
MLPGFDGLTNAIIVMDIGSTTLKLSEPFSDVLYSIYAIIAINIYELAVNFDGGNILRS